MKNNSSKNMNEEFAFEDFGLVKQTLMACAFPALVSKYNGEDGEEFYKGFLPGFEDANVSDLTDENECVEYLQDLLDDKVEELIVEGKMLPDVEEDKKLLKDNPDYKIVYLDINVYALPEGCGHHCHECHGECDGECDCDDDCDHDEDEEYDDCGCGHSSCHCGDHCTCSEDNSCGCDCSKSCDCDDDCDCDDNCSCGCKDK